MNFSPITYIYALKDPVSGAFRYVGKADNVKRRFRSHLDDKSDNHRTRWIKGLKKNGNLPLVMCLEVVSLNDWQTREKWWIAELRRQGFDLTNTADGGYGAGRFSEETRQKMSLSKKRWIDSLSTEAREEYRKKRSEIASRVLPGTGGGWPKTRSSASLDRQRATVLMNPVKHPHATCSLPGVSWCSKRSRWRATFRGKHLGYFDLAIEAGDKVEGERRLAIAKLAA